MDGDTGAAEHPLARLRLRLERGEALVAGVLSGTSADGIDVALARCGSGRRPELCAFETRAFPAELGERVRAVLDGRPPALREVALLARDLGLAFGRAASELARREGLRLDLVGSHGQTVYHHDGVEPSGPASLQLGDGDFVAAASGAPTVSDFRAADMAAGGQGAPLSALVDGELFAAAARPLTILNLGGIANVTWLASDAPLLAFDTGPANCLSDALARALLARPFDPDGVHAGAGRVHAELLAELCTHPFFERRPPKSTGCDTFGPAWVAGVLERGRALRVGLDDLFATAAALVAESVARALARDLPGPPGRLVLCGGGARNRALVRELALRTGLETLSSDGLGVDPDAREALVFAVLAARFVLGRPSSEPAATGARSGAILGKLSLPTVRSGFDVAPQ
jgi:anhydro-N-acetylmuramic acid kinase